MDVVRKHDAHVSPLADGATSRQVTAVSAMGSQSLGERFRAGDHGAVDEVLTLLGRRLVGYIDTLVKSRETAEDLLQDVLVTAYSRRSQITTPDRLESWLFSLARHAALNELRRPRHRREQTETHEDLEARVTEHAPPHAPRALHEERVGAILRQAIDVLDEKRRDIIGLRYYSGLSHKEIGEVLQMPIGSVGTTINRALEQLRKNLTAQGFTPEDLFP